MGSATIASNHNLEGKRKLVRRSSSDGSHRIRRIVQWLFLALNGWLGIQFFVWVRFCERSGTGLSVSRPAGTEGWLPIAGLMNTKYFFLTGRVPAIHPAAMVLFIAFLLMSLLLKKAFCSWLCPVGTLSEHLWKLGRRVFGRNLHAPNWVDIPLRGLKYLLLGFFVFMIGAMSAEAIHDFMSTPYGLVADVKMLNFFRDIGQTAVIDIGLLVLLSMLIQNFWCRCLCPYGALLGITSLLSPVKIRRDVEACIIAENAREPVLPALPLISSCKFDPLNARRAWRVSPRAQPRALCNSRWCQERQQHPLKDGVVAHSHPLPLQQLQLVSSWAWS